MRYISCVFLFSLWSRSAPIRRWTMPIAPRTIEAQTYARALYERCGFRQTSEEFLEDGIPHIQMQMKL